MGGPTRWIPAAGPGSGLGRPHRDRIRSDGSGTKCTDLSLAVRSGFGIHLWPFWLKGLFSHPSGDSFCLLVARVRPSTCSCVFSAAEPLIGVLLRVASRLFFDFSLCAHNDRTIVRRI